MKTTFRRMGLPTLFLSGAIVGSALTGVAFAEQGHMENALAALNTAKDQLKLANDDKGGHRRKAVDLVDQAITEVNAGINYAASNH